MKVTPRFTKRNENCRERCDDCHICFEQGEEYLVVQIEKGGPGIGSGKRHRICMACWDIFVVEYRAEAMKLDLSALTG